MPQPPEKEEQGADPGPTGRSRCVPRPRTKKGAARDFCRADQAVRGARTARVDALGVRAHRLGEGAADGRTTMVEIPDSGFQLKADLVLLAMGFSWGPRKPGMLEQSGVALDPARQYRSQCEGLSDFCPQAVRGRKICVEGNRLVVWAIREGRQWALAVDR